MTLDEHFEQDLLRFIETGVEDATILGELHWPLKKLGYLGKSDWNIHDGIFDVTWRELCDDFLYLVACDLGLEHHFGERCLICRKIMDVPDDLLSTNCGGDCVECMADAGDPDCQRTVNEVRPGTYELEDEVNMDAFSQIPEVAMPLGRAGGGLNMSIADEDDCAPD
jgi:hypothetical protein